ncbi:hypothetical protein GWK47_034947 [Chionoecetes opilio]|uniref:Uncharacterized protein n=1 Tax=Chionoecetes opilio TaxID=41210 RepID=A0A8J4YQU4_CHIOP|nr:hypothetical protein GWK47_034947 [Chionoecetes opilio]
MPDPLPEPPRARAGWGPEKHQKTVGGVEGRHCARGAPQDLRIEGAKPENLLSITPAGAPKARAEEPRGHERPFNGRADRPGEGGAQSSRRSTKAHSHPTGRPGREKSDPRRGRRALRQRLKKATKGQKGGRLPLLKFPRGKKLLLPRVGPPREVLGKKRDPGGNQPSTETPRPGEPGVGPRTRKGPPFTLGGTRLHTFGRVQPGPLSRAPGWPPKKATWHPFPPRREATLTKLGSASKRPEHPKRPPKKPQALRGSVQRRKETGVREKGSVPVPRGRRTSKSGKWGPRGRPPDDPCKKPPVNRLTSNPGASVPREKRTGGKRGDPPRVLRRGRGECT